MVYSAAPLPSLDVFTPRMNNRPSFDPAELLPMPPEHNSTSKCIEGRLRFIYTSYWAQPTETRNHMPAI